MNKRVFGALGTVILGVAFIAGVGSYVANAKNDSRVLAATPAGTMDTPQGTLPHATLEISVYPDSMAGSHGENGGAHPGYVTYGPVTNYEVPAHSVITMTVTNYDGGESLNNDYFARVRGTIDGSALLHGEVKQEPFSAKLIKIPGDDFLQTLRSKLNWGLDVRN